MFTLACMYRLYACIHMYMYACLCVHTSATMHICMCVLMMYMYVCESVCTYVCDIVLNERHRYCIELCIVNIIQVGSRFVVRRSIRHTYEYIENDFLKNKFGPLYTLGPKIEFSCNFSVDDI